MASISRLSHFFKRLQTKNVEQKTVVLTRRTIYILPTKAGGTFAVVLLVMLVGSMNYNNSMGYLLTFLLASMAMVSILHTHKNLLGLKIEVGKSQPVFAGEKAQFQLWIDNREHAKRYALKWQQHSPVFYSPGSLSNISANSLTTIDIPENQRVTVTIPVAATQRGWVNLGKVVVVTQFPLNLFYAWSNIQLTAKILVYPAPLGQISLPTHHSDSQHTGSGQQQGSGEDFIGYRDYQLSDPPRHVDWKAVAKERGWFVKQFGGTQSDTVWLGWESVQHLSDTETALSQLCLWVLMVDKQTLQYGLKLPQQTFEPNVGEQHRERCLRALALFDR